MGKAKSKVRQQTASVLHEGLVTKSTGSWYDIRTVDKSLVRGRLKGKFKISGFKVTNPIAVGDKVLYSHEPDQEGFVVIEDILQRENYLIRKSVHKTGHAHLIATNLDQALLVASLFLPRTSTGFIDRFVVSAESFRIPTTVVFNKADLLQGEELDIAQWLCSVYENAGCKTVITSTVNGHGMDELHQLLVGKTTLLSGHSGVGKSSLVNYLYPGLDLRTQEVSDFAEKGKHTTTFAEMFELETDTNIIDTPGIKELGLAEIERQELGHYFPEFRALMTNCKFNNCLHDREPGCAIRAAVEGGKIPEIRYKSYLSMLLDEESHR